MFASCRATGILANVPYPDLSAEMWSVGCGTTSGRHWIGVAGRCGAVSNTGMADLRGSLKNAPTPQPDWAREPDVEWADTNPLPQRNENNWSTWNLCRCRTTEAPLVAFPLMDAEGNPVEAPLSMDNPVWELPPRAKCARLPGYLCSTRLGIKADGQLSRALPRALPAMRHCSPWEVTETAGSPAPDWPSGHCPHGRLLRLPRDGVPIRRDWFRPRAR